MMHMEQPIGAAASANCQGSRVPCAQAEKALSSTLVSPTSAPCGQPSNLSLLRLDGWNPHKHWLRQPPNLANLHARTRTRTHARIRVCDQSANPLFVKPKNRLGRLGGWRDQCLCGFQPSNLPSNLFKVGLGLTDLMGLMYRPIATILCDLCASLRLLHSVSLCRVDQGCLPTLQRYSPHQHSLVAGYAGFAALSARMRGIIQPASLMCFFLPHDYVLTLHTMHTLLRVSAGAGSDVAGLVEYPVIPCISLETDLNLNTDRGLQ